MHARQHFSDFLELSSSTFIPAAFNRHNLTSLSEFTRLRHVQVPPGVPVYLRRKGITFSNETSIHILNLGGMIFATASFSRSTENTKQVKLLECIAAKFGLCFKTSLLVVILSYEYSLICLKMNL